MEEYPVPYRGDVHAGIRECFCDTCGLIAPTWFHSNFVLHGTGFTCIWCALPHLDNSPKPIGPYRVPGDG